MYAVAIVHVTAGMQNTLYTILGRERVIVDGDLYTLIA